jgi:two-component system chemotaxis response regulator CheY
MANKRPTVIIVDDNGITRTLLRGIIRAEEFDVIGEASLGAQGLAMAGQLQPDIVCLDIEMPDMNGMDILRELRTTQPQIAVVMITAHSERENIQGALDNGAGGYVVKPFNIAKVAEALRRALALVKTARG